MPNLHDHEFDILSRIHDAQLLKHTLTRKDVDGFLNLFKKDGQPLEGNELRDKCTVFNDIIENHLTGNSLSKQLVFIQIRELNAQESSYLKASKERHNENFKRISAIHEALPPEKSISRVKHRF